jgi:DNA repair exonuclease SbcCD ATPase subunit
MAEARHQQLTDQLKKNQDAIAGLQQQNASLQAQIKILETYQAELKKATDAYPKTVSDALQNELTGDNAVIANKTKIAESVIKELKDPVDQAIADFQKAFDEQGTKAQEAADAATKAAADNDAAVKTLHDRQAAYMALQNQPKTLDAGLKDLKALLDQIAKAEAQDDFLATYFYSREAEAQAKGIAIPTPDDYSAQLVKAQSDIDAANTDAATKKAALDKATAAAADAQKAYDAAVAARRTTLLAKLRDVKAPAPAEPSPPAPPARRGAAGSADAGSG